MSSTIRIDLTVPMETRDGTVLRADVFRPNDDDRYLVFLTKPLQQNQLPENPFLDPVDSAVAGYAASSRTLRSRHTSEGEYSLGERVFSKRLGVTVE